jgi:hypothetical protein
MRTNGATISQTCFSTARSESFQRETGESKYHGRGGTGNYGGDFGDSRLRHIRWRCGLSKFCGAARKALVRSECGPHRMEAELQARYSIASSACNDRVHFGLYFMVVGERLRVADRRVLSLRFDSVHADRDSSHKQDPRRRQARLVLSSCRTALAPLGKTPRRTHRSQPLGLRNLPFCSPA